MFRYLKKTSEIYKSTWTWLNKRGCAALVYPQLLERYATQTEQRHTR